MAQQIPFKPALEPASQSDEALDVECVSPDGRQAEPSWYRSVLFGVPTSIRVRRALGAALTAIRLRPPGRRWHIAKVAYEQWWLRRRL